MLNNDTTRKQWEIQSVKYLGENKGKSPIFQQTNDIFKNDGGGEQQRLSWNILKSYVSDYEEVTCIKLILPQKIIIMLRKIKNETVCLKAL